MPRWRKWEEELILNMTLAGKQPGEILEHLPDRTLAALQTYMCRQDLFHVAPPSLVRPKVRSKAAAIRRCMTCRRNFGSEWIGNRICTQCKSESLYQAA